MDRGQVPSPGEIYRAEYPRGHDARILIVSRESLNRGEQVIAVNITSVDVERRSSYPNCVRIDGGHFGLNKDSIVQCENILALRKGRIDAAPLGILDAETMRSVIKALAYVFEADLERT
jgi:mRNA-degrading endonuclease toxin of MazEF toxin-antitoxin module